MPLQAHVVALAGGHLPAGLILAGSLLMAVATVLGALLALRRPGRHEAWLGAAAGALLVIAGLHLLPDAWSAARAAISRVSNAPLTVGIRISCPTRRARNQPPTEQTPPR